MNRRFIDKGLLYRIEFSVFALQAFDRQNALAVRPDCKVNTAIDGHSIHQHGTGAAFSYFTAFFNARQRKPIAKRVGKRFPNINGKLMLLPVHLHTNNF